MVCGYQSDPQASRQPVPKSRLHDQYGGTIRHHIPTFGKQQSKMILKF